MRKAFLILILLISLIGIIALINNYSSSRVQTFSQTDQTNDDQAGLVANETNPLSIEVLRNGDYPGSDIIIEQTLSPGSNYERYIGSYKSEGLKIYALLTVPNGDPPAGGWPVVIFNHGFIQPAQYRTTERYVAYTDAFSRAGYIVFRSDYRGHGNSEGQPTGAYGSNNYTIDILNAVSSIKKYKEADASRIGMWGHSMGGHITLRAMVVNSDIKAGVIWAGVVASYPDLLNNWRRRRPSATPSSAGTSRSWRQTLVAIFGEPEANPDFWNSISATSYLADISGPVQLHHGTADSSVPVAFSEKLNTLLQTEGKTSELYTYPGDDHNMSNNFGSAIGRSVEFFDKYVKGSER